MAFELRLTVGRVSLTLGSPHGTKADPAVAPEEANAEELREAFARSPPPPSQAARAAEAVEGTAAEAEEVAAGIERANDVVQALAKGLTLDPKALEQQVNALLDLLDRADRDGRFDDELRLARALVRLLALVPRWVALVEALRRTASAAAAVGDRATEAWAHHELGTFGLGAGDANAASGHLNEALRLRESIGDEAGAALTRHNLRLLATPPPDRPWWRRVPRRLLVAGGVAAVLIATAGGLAVAGMVGGDDDEPNVTVADETEANETETAEPTPENGPPTARDQAIEVEEDGEADWTPEVDDPEGDALRCRVVRNAANGLGTIEADCTGGRYVPNGDFAGDDAFAYEVLDADGRSAGATVAVTVRPVNDTPVAGDDQLSVEIDAIERIEIVEIPVERLLENDVDADGDALSVAAVAPEDRVRVEGDTIQYALAGPPFTFTYTAADPSGATDDATVTIDPITIEPPPPEPTPPPPPIE